MTAFLVKGMRIANSANRAIIQMREVIACRVMEMRIARLASRLAHTRTATCANSVLRRILIVRVARMVIIRSKASALNAVRVTKFVLLAMEMGT